MSKINYLRYTEIDFLNFAAILIRPPRFGEITYMSSYNRFTKKRFPLFENVKSKHLIFSRLQYSKILILC